MDKLKWAAFGLALGIIGGGIGNAAADKWLPGVTRFDTIEARRLKIINDKGKQVAELTTGIDGVGLMTIYNNRLKPVAHLTANLGGGGVLGIYDDRGEQVVGLAALTNGGGLTIFNNRGIPVYVRP